MNLYIYTHNQTQNSNIFYIQPTYQSRMHSFRFDEKESNKEKK